jgi:hypothetical protein
MGFFVAKKLDNKSFWCYTIDILTKQEFNMNERIQELAEQATIRGEEYLPGCDGHPTPTFYFDKEKFAELVVRECMQVANTYQNRGGNCYVDDMIKEHFGIEE